MSDTVITDLLQPAGARNAIDAWQRLGGRTPGAVVVLCEREKGSAFRFEGAGEQGTDVIAKFSPACIAAVERAVYEQVLARAGLDDLHYYGFVDEGRGGWIFLEDARGERWVRTDQEHRVLAGRWAARMHVHAAAASATAALPALGLHAQRERVARVRADIKDAHDNPSLGAPDFAVLDGVAAQLDRIEAAWHRMEDACLAVPQTLVHGDLRPKNARVRAASDEPRFVVFDWEMAGFGVPAADLARVDTAAYAEVVATAWPHVDAKACRTLAKVGRVFRNLDAVRWETCGLEGDWQENRILKLGIYRDRLNAVINDLLRPDEGSP
jgi:hypothetical protein